MSGPHPISDTTPEARRRIADIYARMTPAEKLRQVQDLTRAVAQLALAGLRLRHPRDSESELLLRLARLRLGDALVDAAYPANVIRRGA